MQVCSGIEKVDGGYIVTVRFPFGMYSNGGKVICTTWAEVVELLRQAADEPKDSPNAG